MTSRREPTERKLLREMLRCQFDLEEMSKGASLSLEELAVWGAGGKARAQLQGLRFLEDMRVQFVVSRHRVSAVTALIDLIDRERKNGEGDPEKLRRACAELLRLSVVPEATGAELSRVDDEAEELVGDEKLLAALGRLGGRAGEQENGKGEGERDDRVSDG